VPELLNRFGANGENSQACDAIAGSAPDAVAASRKIESEEDGDVRAPEVMPDEPD
jgi:hypothetical protein